MTDTQELHPDKLIGRQLGSYTIVRQLGAGSSARVYLADQPGMFRQVALKVFTPELDKANPLASSRFRHEIQAVSSLEHLHILPVYESGTIDGITYLAMRLADQSLDTYLLKARPLPLPEVARLLDQVASALDYAHSHRIIHRDLKPANILLDAQKNCLLADFGIAYMMETTVHLTPDKMIMGTPMYMSPEQILREPITARSDIYSLGMIAYELICGEPPFHGSVQEILAQQIHATVPPLTSCRPDLPAAVSAAVLRALHKNPSSRFDTAQDFTRILTKSLPTTQTQPIVIEPPDPTTIRILPFPPIPNTTDVLSANEPTRTATRRPPLVAFGVILAILVVIGISTFLLIRRPDPALAAQDNDSGLQALQQLDYGNAIDKFQAAIRADPNYAASYFNLGVAYEERADASKNDIESALTAYRQALDHDSRLLLARYRLAELLLDQKQNEEAFNVIDIGVRTLNQSDLKLTQAQRNALTFMLYTTRARAYWQLGGDSNLNLALEDLKIALDDKKAVDYVAEAYYIEAKIAEAQQDSRAAQSAWSNVLATSDQQNARHRVWIEEARQYLQAQNPTSTPSK